MGMFSSTMLPLLLLLSVGMMMLIVEADTCAEDLGTCAENCSGMCTSKHPGGRGDCVNVDGGGNVCRCFYDCPKPKTCTEALGRCSARCNEQCCDQTCKNKRSNGKGYCDYSLGPANAVCVCGYGC